MPPSFTVQAVQMATGSGIDLKEFGRRLHDARTDSGLTQKMLAEALSEHLDISLTPSAVGNWERGDDEPSRDKVFALEELLATPPGLLSAPLGYLPIDARDEHDYNSRITRMPARVRRIIDRIIDDEERQR